MTAPIAAPVDAAASAKNAYAANNDGGDRLEVELRGDDGVDSAEARAPQDADQSAQETRQNEDERHDAACADAENVRAFRIASDSVDVAVASDLAVPRQHADAHGYDQRQPDEEREPLQLKRERNALIIIG